MATITKHCPACNRDVEHERAVAVEEFHNRLKRNVRLLTCDIKPALFMEGYARTLSLEDLRFLVKLLNFQVHQVVQAVKDARGEE
jgi:hypothetical protein